jgi:hypothetical protein
MQRSDFVEADSSQMAAVFDQHHAEHFEAEEIVHAVAKYPEPHGRGWILPFLQIWFHPCLDPIVDYLMDGLCSLPVIRSVKVDEDGYVCCMSATSANKASVHHWYEHCRHVCARLLIEILHHSRVRLTAAWERLRIDPGEMYRELAAFRVHRPKISLTLRQAFRGAPTSFLRLPEQQDIDAMRQISDAKEEEAFAEDFETRHRLRVPA